MNFFSLAGVKLQESPQMGAKKSILFHVNFYENGSIGSRDRRGDRPCTCNLTLMLVRLTIVAVAKQ
jgi:hypothetical protein